MQFSIISLQVVVPNLQVFMIIQKQLYWCMVQQVPFTKSRSLQQRIETVQTIPYKLKFNSKIARYPAMPFMMMSQKEIFRTYLELCKTLVMDLFQKQEKLKYDGLEFLRGLTYFKTHRLKMLELCDGMKEGSKIELLFVFKINQEMQVLQTDKNCK